MYDGRGIFAGKELIFLLFKGKMGSGHFLEFRPDRL